MAKSILIVEDESDKCIFEAIIRHIKKEDSLEVFPEQNTEIEYVIKSDESNVEKPSGLIDALNNLTEGFSKQHITRVGIIRDIDFNTLESRILLVNNAIRSAYKIIYGELKNVNQLTTIQLIDKDTQREYKIDFACHFVSLNGSGEIEDILKSIKCKPSPIADCVDEHLPNCLIASNQELKDKDLVKLWLNHYQRYDTLPKNKRKSPFTEMTHIMKNRTEIFDFDNNLKELLELKSFLRMMSE